MSTTFAQLGVPSFICDALERRGITEPFEIQAVTVADGLAGRDVCGRAPTGSGKTLAFGVPMIVNTAELGNAAPRRPHSLILAPTRELADQITAELRSFSGRVRVDAVYGGVGYGAQLTALKRGVDVLVACPGRLEDLIQRRDVALDNVTNVVLDEADRMADMGFMPAVRRLLDQVASDRQTVLFSATLDGDVAKLTADYQNDPVRHEVGEATPDIKAAVHKFWTAERTDRNPIVAEVVKASWPSIVFVRTRHGADRLARQLGKLGLEAAPIHGGRSQSQRNRALADFTKGRVHALVATDVAARGIHVDGVASVVHYDPPEDHKTYVHRSGRTARAGADGLVVSLVQPGQKKDYRKVQHEIGLKEPFTEPDATMLPEGALAGDRELAPAGPPATPEPAGRNNTARSQRTRRKHSNKGQRRATSGGGHAGGGRGSNGQRRDANGSSRADGDRGSSSPSSKRNRGSGARADKTAGTGGQRSKNSKPSGSGPKAGKNGGQSTGRPNRKARRAHLQPGAKR